MDCCFRLYSLFLFECEGDVGKKTIIGICLAVATLAAAGSALFLNAATATYDVEEISDLGYVEGSNDYFQLLDLYLPKRDKNKVAQKKSPVIIWVHGGSWRYGDKKDTPATAFAQRGFAVASLNYRLIDKAKFPAQIQDCKAAIRWLRAHAAEYNLDPDRFAAFGMSAGGHLVALLGVTNDDKQFDNVGGNEKYSSKVQCVCDWCGPTDLFTLQKQSEKEQTKLDWVGKDSPLRLFLGDSPEKVPQIGKQASPVTYVKAHEPPFLIMHGSKDQVVPFAQSQELYDALKKENNDVQLITVKGGEHNFASAETLVQAWNFFEEKMK